MLFYPKLRLFGRNTVAVSAGWIFEPFDLQFFCKEDIQPSLRALQIVASISKLLPGIPATDAALAGGTPAATIQ
jgi:hypothetical protein